MGRAFAVLRIFTGLVFLSNALPKVFGAQNGDWGLFGVFLTIAELAIGLGLFFGAVTRLAAVGALLLIAPIWVMQWNTGLYLWEYPAEDLLLLALLATIPAGRVAGVDARLAPGFHHRWPFSPLPRPRRRTTAGAGD